MYHDMYHDVQQMGLQARSTRTSGSKHHLYGPYELAGPIWIMYCDMENMGSQARYASCTMIWSIWARISADMQVRQAICVMYMAGPIHILYHDMRRELVDTHLHSRADVCLCFM